MTNIRVSEEVYENASKIKEDFKKVFGFKITWSLFIALGTAYIKKLLEEVGKIVEVAEAEKEEK